MHKIKFLNVVACFWSATWLSYDRVFMSYERNHHGKIGKWCPFFFPPTKMSKIIWVWSVNSSNLIFATRRRQSPQFRWSRQPHERERFFTKFRDDLRFVRQTTKRRGNTGTVNPAAKRVCRQDTSAGHTKGPQRSIFSFLDHWIRNIAWWVFTFLQHE